MACSWLNPQIWKNLQFGGTLHVDFPLGQGSVPLTTLPPAVGQLCYYSPLKVEEIKS